MRLIEAVLAGQHIGKDINHELAALQARLLQHWRVISRD